MAMKFLWVQIASGFGLGGLEEMEWMPPPNRTGGGESPRKGVLA